MRLEIPNRNFDSQIIRLNTNLVSFWRTLTIKSQY